MQLTPRDERMLKILGVVAGLALIYLLFITVLGGDDGGEVTMPTGPTGPAPVESAVTPSPTPRETLPPVLLAGARDPFSIPPGLSPSGSVGPTPTGTTTQPPVTTQPPGTTVPPTTTPPPGEAEPSDQISIGEHHVRLVSIFAQGTKAQVEVDGGVWTVEVGAIFDDNFKLVRIRGRCARFLFGDQSFTLCLQQRK